MPGSTEPSRGQDALDDRGNPSTQGNGSQDASQAVTPNRQVEVPAVPADPAVPTDSAAPAAQAAPAPAGARARGLVRRLGRGALRFPAVVVLLGIASLIHLLSIYGVLELWAPSAGGSVTVGSLAADLASACLLAITVAVAAQLACERYGCDARRSQMAQGVAACCSVAAFVLVAIAGRLLDRVMLCSLMQGGVSLACLALIPWLLMTEGNERTLVPRLAGIVVYTGALAMVLLVGLCVCILAFDVLILGGYFLSDRLYEASALLCLAFLGPNLLCSQLPRHDDGLRVPPAYHGVVGHAIFPLCLVLLSVLYAYVGEVAITRVMPSGEMNWFGSFALLVWVCLWLGLRDLDERPARWFVRWGWALLVSVVAVQLVGVFIRLRAYGLTQLRLASLVCTGLGVYALVRAALGRSPRRLFAVAAVTCLVVAVTPANVIDVANLSQTMRLRATLDEIGSIGPDGLARRDVRGVAATEEQRERITSAWEYLCAADRGYLSDPLVEDLRERSSDEGFDELFGFSPLEGAEGDERLDAEPTWHSYDFVAETSTLEVAGVSRVYDLDLADDNELTLLSASDGFALSLSWDDGTQLDTNLKDLVRRLMERPPTMEPGEYAATRTVPSSDLTMTLDDGRTLVLRSVSVGTEDGETSDVTVSGWLLVP